MSDNENMQLGALSERGIMPRSMEEMLTFASNLHSSGLAPSSFKTPQQIFIAMAMALECNLPILRGLSCIAVINGRACLWGDVLLAKVHTSGLMESYHTSYRGVPYADDYCAIVKLKRKGMPEHVSTFSVADAKDAGLYDKAGPWKNYPQRMLLSRARAFALRDTFPDVLLGMHDREEQEDIRAGAIEAETTRVDVPAVKLGQNTDPQPTNTPAKAAALPEAEKTVHLAPRQARQTDPVKQADLAPAATHQVRQVTSQSQIVEPAPADEIDYRGAILQKLSDHPTGITEAEFMDGLRGLNLTTRTGSSLEPVGPEKLKKLYAQIDKLIGQVADYHAAQKSPM